MTELTKEHFDSQVLKLLETMATRAETNAHFENTDAVLAQHTAALDGIARSILNWNTELSALRSTVKRHDDLLAEIAKRLGINLKEYKA